MDEVDVWRYEGRRAVVTGAASGIGQATAEELIRLGAHVIGLDVDEVSVPVAERQRVDLADEASIDAVVDAIGGGIDALFNCAGLSNQGAGAEAVFRVNLVGTRHLTEAVVPLMPPGSAIANVASSAGFEWRRDLDLCRSFLRTEGFAAASAWFHEHPTLFARGAYGFTKRAIIVYTKQRCIELAGRGIRINSIAPSATSTPMLDRQIAAEGEDGPTARGPMPFGKLPTAIDQARPMVYLNSPAAAFITGQNIFVDGGIMGGTETGALDYQWPHRG
jgi:NAD(P)-dependent dehydrogenase (short-subunit alcohol dehydrogenase family)